MDKIKTNMDIGLLIAECTAYDFKVMLEENRPKSWLEGVYTPYYYVGDGQRVAFVRNGDESLPATAEQMVIRITVN